jgi:hypothetical protein
VLLYSQFSVTRARAAVLASGFLFKSLIPDSAYADLPRGLLRERLARRAAADERVADVSQQIRVLLVPSRTPSSKSEHHAPSRRTCRHADLRAVIATVAALFVTWLLTQGILPSIMADQTP